MDNKKLTELIHRYKTGTATPEEIALLDKFWSAEGEAVQKDHTSKELEEIQRDMFFAIKDQIEQHESQSRIVSIRPLVYKVAASITVVLAVALWWFNSSNHFTEIKTAFGEHKTVTLPDNSQVILNGNSILKYSANWDATSSREVWLEGEGFFSVTHTANNQKFIVHGSGELDVEVLGTKFNMKTRNDASEVMLTEGKVRLAMGEEKNAKELFLKPGDLATVRNKDLSTRSVKHHNYTSWVDNKLVFDRTPLRELATLLHDTYGLTVTFESRSLEERELSGEISSATADDILYAIAETFNLKIEKEGDAVTISANNK
ncbi:MAG TPA: FecR domain-containing protein [Sphingobacteriaceae bacterium]